MNRKILFGTTMVVLLVSIAISGAITIADRTNVDNENETCACCVVCQKAKSALIAIEKGDVDKAKGMIRDALEEDCKDQEIMFHLKSAGKALLENDIDLAERHLRKIVIRCDVIK